MVALLYASIVVSTPLCSLCPGDGEGAIVQDGLVVVLKDKVFFFLLFYISTVDFFSSVFALPKSSDIKIIVQDTLYCGDAPSGFYLSVIFFTGGLLSASLRLNLPIIPVCPQPAENSTWSLALDTRS